MKQPAIEDFKAWAREHSDLAYTVCQVTAFAQVEKERVSKYIRPIFDRYQFPVLARYAQSYGETVEKPEDLYLCDDEARCQAYFDDCDTAHRQHGFDGPAGHCPALVAEHAQSIIENQLLRAGCALFGLEDIPVLENRKRMLKLLIGACLKARSEKEEAANG